MTDSIGGSSGLRLADDCWRSGALQAAIFSSVPEIVQSVAVSAITLGGHTFRFVSRHVPSRVARHAPRGLGKRREWRQRWW